MKTRLAIFLSLFIGCGNTQETPCYEREIGEKMEFIGFNPSAPDFCVFKITISYLCGPDKIELVNRKCIK